ncbi:MAG TPA: hypothetical protein VMY37_21340 [Thermoguttaceae bacterium]|nr:hypothetical protein [Thermoguttaceae bacterium]
MDEAARQPHDHFEAPDQRLPQEKGRKAGHAGVVHALRKLGEPLVKRVVKHPAKIRRWSGLALGIGLMAGGLEPIGFSLILLGTAMLLLEFDRPQ